MENKIKQQKVEAYIEAFKSVLSQDSVQELYYKDFPEAITAEDKKYRDEAVVNLKREGFLRIFRDEVGLFVHKTSYLADMKLSDSRYVSIDTTL